MSGDYPGEIRMGTEHIGAEQVAFTWRRMVPGTGGKGSYGHRHRTQEELIFVVSGTVEVKLEDEVIEVGPGHVVRISPEVLRSVWNEGPEDAAPGARLPAPRGPVERGRAGGRLLARLGADRRRVLDLQRGDRHAVAPPAVGAVLARVAECRTCTRSRRRRSCAGRPRPSSRSSSRRRRPALAGAAHTPCGGERRGRRARRCGSGRGPCSRFGMWPSFGKIALQLPSALFGSEMTPSALEWHCELHGRRDARQGVVHRGLVEAVRPPSCGSSRKIARGFGRCSFR